MERNRMKTVTKSLGSKKILGAIAILGLILPGINAASSQASTSQPQIDLGTSVNYVLLAHQALTNGASTIISGTGSRIVGISPGISAVGTVSSFLASGASEFQNDTLPPTLAQADLLGAMASIGGLTPTTVGANLSLANDDTIYPGVYTTPGGAAMSVDGNLILDAQGNTNAVFVFIAPTAFNTSAGVTVSLINGAQASNIYWLVGAGMTFGASTTIQGNFLVSADATVGASSVVTGRILGRGAITLGASVNMIA